MQSNTTAHMNMQKKIYKAKLSNIKINSNNFSIIKQIRHVMLIIIYLHLSKNW